MPQGAPNLAATSRRFSSLHSRRRYPAPTSALGLEQQGAATDTPVWIHSWAEPGQTLEVLPEGLEGRDVIAGTASATVEEKRLRAPAATSRADSSETAPCRRSVSSAT